MSAVELIAIAAQCETCGKEHKPRKQRDGFAPTWASPDDGHPYQSRIQRGVVDKLRTLAVNS
jgi:hypothetical protein